MTEDESTKHQTENTHRKRRTKMQQVVASTSARSFAMNATWSTTRHIIVTPKQRAAIFPLPPLFSICTFPSVISLSEIAQTSGTGTKTKTHTVTCVFGTRLWLVPLDVCCRICGPSRCLTTSRSCRLRRNGGVAVVVLTLRFCTLSSDSMSKENMAKRNLVINGQASRLQTASCRHRREAFQSATSSVVAAGLRWWPVSLWRQKDDPTRKTTAEINCERTLLRMAISPARNLMQGARTADDMEWTLDEVSSNARHHVLPLPLQTLTLSCCGT